MEIKKEPICKTRGTNQTPHPPTLVVSKKLKFLEKMQIRGRWPTLSLPPFSRGPAAGRTAARGRTPPPDGCTTEDQVRQVFELLRVTLPNLAWAGVLTDPPEERRTPLLARSQGQRLAELPPGTHVIAALSDLGFARPKDALRDLDQLVTAGVVLNFVEVLDFGPDGRQALQEGPVGMAGSWLAALQWLVDGEHARRSGMARVRAERIRPQGRAGGRSPRRGYKRRGPKEHRSLVLDYRYLRIALFVGHCREQLGMSWWKIADAVEEAIAKEEGRKAYTRGSGKRKWSMSRTRDAYFAFKLYYPGFDLRTLYPEAESDRQEPENTEQDERDSEDGCADCKEPVK